MDQVRYDGTGKVDMSGIYDNADPTRYFSTLALLGYRIPQEAKQYFRAMIDARRRERGVQELKIIDLGSSYGVNAALLKFGLSMDDLYRHYAVSTPQDRASLIARDRKFYAEPADAALSFIGVDRAERAVAYARAAGLLDGGVMTNLEERGPTRGDTSLLAGADLIFSTGCFGYVTEKSIERLLIASADSRPWMAHFVLRMFDFGKAIEALARHGYVTEKAEGLFRQRRFASPEEKRNALANLGRRGIATKDAEATGWYQAELFVARPSEAAEAAPLDSLLRGIAPPLAA